MTTRTYIDTSVLTAYYLPESQSGLVQDALLRVAFPVVSQLCVVELSSALARNCRERKITQDEARTIIDMFAAHLDQGMYAKQSIESQHYALAKNLITTFSTSLRSLDALHLSVAMSLPATLLTSDVKLHQSAVTLGARSTLLGNTPKTGTTAEPIDPKTL